MGIPRKSKQKNLDALTRDHNGLPPHMDLQKKEEKQVIESAIAEFRRQIKLRGLSEEYILYKHAVIEEMLEESIKEKIATKESFVPEANAILKTYEQMRKSKLIDGEAAQNVNSNVTVLSEQTKSVFDEIASFGSDGSVQVPVPD